MPADALRPRTTSEILDDSIQLLRGNYGALLLLSVIALVPRLVYSVYSGSFLVPSMLAGKAAWLVWSLPLSILVLAWVLVMDAAMILVASGAYRGEPVAPGAALGTALARAGSVLASGLVKYLMIGLGFVLPGILAGIAIPVLARGGAANAGLAAVAGLAILVMLVFAIWWGLKMFARYFAIPTVVVLEGLTWRPALRRSRALARGETGKILVTLALLFLIYGLVSLSIGAFLGALLPNAILAQVIAQVIVMFAYPILDVATVGLYYDIRVRKEALDIELMTERLAPIPVQHPAL